MASSRIDVQRTFIRKAAKTGAAQRARKSAGIPLSTAAHKLNVNEATYYRWEAGITMPTHHDNLGAFARFLRRLHVDDDPAMREDSDTTAATAELAGDA